MKKITALLVLFILVFLLGKGCSTSNEDDNWNRKQDERISIIESENARLKTDYENIDKKIWELKEQLGYVNSQVIVEEETQDFAESNVDNSNEEQDKKISAIEAENVRLKAYYESASKRVAQLEKEINNLNNIVKEVKPEETKKDEITKKEEPQKEFNSATTATTIVPGTTVTIKQTRNDVPYTTAIYKCQNEAEQNRAKIKVRSCHIEVKITGMKKVALGLRRENGDYENINYQIHDKGEYVFKYSMFPDKYILEIYSETETYYASFSYPEN